MITKLGEELAKLDNKDKSLGYLAGTGAVLAGNTAGNIIRTPIVRHLGNKVVADFNKHKLSSRELKKLYNIMGVDPKQVPRVQASDIHAILRKHGPHYAKGVGKRLSKYPRYIYIHQQIMPLC